MMKTKQKQIPKKRLTAGVPPPGSFLKQNLPESITQKQNKAFKYRRFSVQ